MPVHVLYGAILVLILLFSPRNAPTYDFEAQWPVIEAPQADPHELEKTILTEYIAKTYPQPVTDIRAIVDSAFKYGGLHNISPSLVLAIIAKESSFNPSAKSSYGAIGLMQVVPRFHPEKVDTITHPDGLKDPDSNVRVGTATLAEYIASKPTLDAALVKYSGKASSYQTSVRGFWDEFKKIGKKAKNPA